jgi:hypothetical protein
MCFVVFIVIAKLEVQAFFEQLYIGSTKNIELTETSPET